MTIGGHEKVMVYMHQIYSSSWMHQKGLDLEWDPDFIANLHLLGAQVSKMDFDFVFKPYFSCFSFYWFHFTALSKNSCWFEITRYLLYQYFSKIQPLSHSKWMYHALCFVTLQSYDHLVFNSNQIVACYGTSYYQYSIYLKGR